MVKCVFLARRISSKRNHLPSLSKLLTEATERRAARSPSELGCARSLHGKRKKVVTVFRNEKGRMVHRRQSFREKKLRVRTTAKRLLVVRAAYTARIEGHNHTVNMYVVS